MILLLVFALFLPACDFESELVTAIKRNDIPTVRTLLEAGNDVNATVDKEQRTPLMLASFYGSSELVDLLVNEGAIVTKADVYGRTPLHYAARAGNCSNIKQLAENGANVNSHEEELYFTPLMEAALAGKPLSAKCLIDLGARLNQQDGSGYTALMQAVWSRNAETVKVFMDAGADTGQRNSQGDTAIDIAHKIGQDEIARALSRDGK